jgi:hypothetical protein
MCGLAASRCGKALPYRASQILEAMPPLTLSGISAQTLSTLYKNPTEA